MHFLLKLSLIFGMSLWNASKLGACEERLAMLNKSKLPYEGRLESGLSFRSSHSEREDRIIVGIPGGPGISGQYMEPFFNELGKRANQEVLLIDLPNHGSSERFDPLNFEVAIRKLRESLWELSGDSSRKITLIGHSLGALLSLEVSARLPHGALNAMVLISTPEILDQAPRLDKAIDESGIVLSEVHTEEDFEIFWHQILPFYFAKADPDILKWLHEQPTFYENTKCFIDGARSLNCFVTEDGDKLGELRLLFIEGEDDLLSGENHLQLLQELFPKSSEFRVIPKTRHFPMLENREPVIKELMNFLKNDD